MAVAAPPAPAVQKKRGQQTLEFTSPPVILATAAVVGPMEGQGPLGHLCDEVTQDCLLGQASWERAEVRYLEKAVQKATAKAGLKLGDLDLVVAGDLLNQLAASSFAGRTLDRPFLGIFAACAAWTAGLTVAAMLVDGGFAARVGVGCSSHHDAAERQFRYPTEFGVQRPPTATWTATGAAAAVVADGGQGPRITHATIGRLVDAGVKDPYDLGSAMAPAAAATLAAHFQDTGRRPDDYDLILTGDLGQVGRAVVSDLLLDAGFHVADRLDDCGLRLYDRRRQDVHAGASGCAASGVVFAAQLWHRLKGGSLRRVLLASTGAMFSPTTYQQGESIPGVAYAVAVEAPGT